MHPRIELDSWISVPERASSKKHQEELSGTLPRLLCIPGLEADLRLMSFPLTPERSQ